MKCLSGSGSHIPFLLGISGEMFPGCIYEHCNLVWINTVTSYYKIAGVIGPLLHDRKKEMASNDIRPL